MNENETKSCRHAIFAWLIAVLLVFILLALVFKIGLMIGWSKSDCSSCRTNDYHKNFSASYDCGVKKTPIVDAYQEKATTMDMTIEEYKTYLIKQKKEEYADFEAKAKANNMTMEEYKVYLSEQKK